MVEVPRRRKAVNLLELYRDWLLQSHMTQSSCGDDVVLRVFLLFMWREMYYQNLR